MIKIEKEISINRFIKLWDEVMTGAFIVNKGKAMGSEILDAWYYEVVKRFYESKSHGSFGELPLNLMESYIRIATSATSTAFSKGFELPKKPYASRRYVREYPETYVKEGDLKRLMKRKGSWNKNINPGSREIVVSVDIPLAIDPDKPSLVYRDLENERSFIKASFIMAWPEILQAIMERLE
ncbi:MAG: hypothetical protein FK731_08890 [Asgard group archaeon]|nr:hypothetical protein [Asgard group archaeon]